MGEESCSVLTNSLILLFNINFNRCVFRIMADLILLVVFTRCSFIISYVQPDLGICNATHFRFSSRGKKNGEKNISNEIHFLITLNNRFFLCWCLTQQVFVQIQLAYIQIERNFRSVLGFSIEITIKILFFSIRFFLSICSATPDDLNFRSTFS